MKNKIFVTGLLAGLNICSSMVSAQEASARSTFNNDNARLSNRVEVLRTMLNSAGDTIQKIVACNEQGALYDRGTGACKTIQPKMGNCQWQTIQAPAKELVCPANKFAAGYGLESGTWQNAKDNHIGPEVDRIYCCSLTY